MSANNYYPETADVETSSDEYAARFSGETGAWMLSVQERITLAFLHDHPKATVLDIGGGHGQLAIPLTRDNFNMTVLSSAESCEHRIRDIVNSRKCAFKVGNVIEFPFSDKSFDVAISFRLLTHCERWPTLVKELCRVARKAVIVDFPTSRSVNAIAPMLFGAKKKIEKDTRHWTLFTHSQVISEFEKNGWRISGKKSQFFFPMVLHRALKNRGLSAAMETIARALGLTALAGSPVIIKAVPQNK